MKLTLVYRFVFLLLFSNGLFITAQDVIDSGEFKVFYYPDGKKSSEGTMRNGQPDGFWKTFHPNGTIKSEGNRKDFLLDSVWTFYSDSGTVILQISYEKGKKNGIRRTVQADGIVEENFVDDVKQGLTRYLYPDGKLFKEIFYTDGLEEGLSKTYSADDSRVIQLVYYKKGFIADIENINHVDRAGFKQGKWIYFYPGGTIRLEGEYKNDLQHGYFKEYNEAGNLVRTEKYIDGVRQEDVAELAKLDIKTEYYPDGKVKIIASFKEGIPEGIRREFSREGEVVKGYVFTGGVVTAEGITDKEGLRDGPWKEFYTTGVLKSEGVYDKGKKKGLWKYYHQNNRLEQTGSYNDEGKEDGLWTWYYPGGSIKREEYFLNGMKDGHSVEYDEQGIVIAEGDYIENLREDNWKFNYGDYREEGKYLNDMMNGEWRSFYNDGTPYFKGKFIDDNPDGRHIWFWPNGNKKLEGEYMNGLKEGEWIRYYTDGTVFISIYYRNGIEIRYDGVRVKIEEEAAGVTIEEEAGQPENQ